MIIPTVFVSDRGFVTEGAGPDLLAELLRALDGELSKANPHYLDSLAPGLSESDVRDRLEAAGLAAIDELSVWWAWHDGLKAGAAAKYRNTQLSLDQALAARSYDAQVNYLFTGGPKWLPVVGELRSALVVACDGPSDETPAVRQVDLESVSVERGLIHPQVYSLCTPVTMWLTALVKGWESFDKAAGSWLIRDIDQYPTEWRLTGVI